VSLNFIITCSVVKVENKKDRRTIEETLAERKAKKMKQSEEPSLATPTPSAAQSSSNHMPAKS